MISDGDVSHLECVEREPFFPIGWLYRGVFRDLLSRGLVSYMADKGFISNYGAEELKKFREAKVSK